MKYLQETRYEGKAETRDQGLKARVATSMNAMEPKAMSWVAVRPMPGKLQVGYRTLPECEDRVWAVVECAEICRDDRVDHKGRGVRECRGLGRGRCRRGRLVDNQYVRFGSILDARGDTHELLSRASAWKGLCRYFFQKRLMNCRKDRADLVRTGPRGKVRIG